MSELEPIFTTACKISLASKGAKSDAKIYLHSVEIPDTFCSKTSFTRLIPGADAIEKFTPSLGIPYLGV